MANTFAPFGFQHVGRLDGAAPNYGQSWAKISSSNSTAIGFGDPVTQLSTGYITKSTAGTTQIKGILIECKYLAIAPAMTIYTRGWGGSNAQADADAAVVDDPQALFLVQGNGQITLAHVGMNANFALGTQTSLGGMTYSGASLDVSTIATTNTLPFRIVKLYTASPGSNGSDTTTPYNWAFVTFNNQDYKSLTGI